MIRWLYYFLRRQWYRRVYLKSKHWREFRDFALAYASWECEYPGCRTTDKHHPKLGNKIRFNKGEVFCIESLDVHHLHYNTLGHERLKDVSVLCRRHHKEIEQEKYPH